MRTCFAAERLFRTMPLVRARSVAKKKRGLHMSNRSYLLNSPVCSSDPRELERSRIADGLSYVELAEAAHRIPLPWLLCFGTEDLRPVDAKFRTGPTDYIELALSIPVTTVSLARERLQASLPSLTEIAGDPAIAEAYWSAAMAGLAKLPFDYLTIDPLEVLAQNDAGTEADAFARCFGARPEALPYLKTLAFFEDGFLPYSHHDLYNKDPSELDHSARAGNAAALDAGIGLAEHWHWRRPDAPLTRSSVPSARDKPWWKLW